MYDVFCVLCWLGVAYMGMRAMAGDSWRGGTSTLPWTAWRRSPRTPSGAAPTATLPTRLLALTCESLSADELAAHLRAADSPVVARVEEGRVLLDLRTVFPEQDEALGGALRKIAAE